MPEQRYASHVINRSDGTRLWVPPDAVFAPIQALPTDIDVELTGATQLFSLGTQMEDIWGRVFRYVEHGGTIAQNSMVDAEIPDVDHDNFDLVTAVVAGDTSILVDSPEAGTADFIVNEYAQGWVNAELVVGGIAYPIASHALWDISATTDLTVYLFKPIRTAIAVNCDLSFTKSKFKEVIIAAAAAASQVVGVNSGSGAVDGRFGWVQTRGPAKVLTAGTVILGEAVVVITTAGAVGPTGADDVSQRVGQVIKVGPTTEWSFINVTLE